MVERRGELDPHFLLTMPRPTPLVNNHKTASPSLCYLPESRGRGSQGSSLFRRSEHIRLWRSAASHLFARTSTRVVCFATALPATSALGGHCADELLGREPSSMNSVLRRVAPAVAHEYVATKLGHCVMRVPHETSGSARSVVCSAFDSMTL